jgi:2-C-methyl-D-erythritol 4-phosphate cytidylyltransferase
MIVIPMAGKSRRFLDAGYNLPKYKLKLGSKTIFEWVVLSFENYFLTQHFKFIIQESLDYDNFVEQNIKKLGILNFSIIKLKENTRGQAETVYNGTILEEIDQEIRQELQQVQENMAQASKSPFYIRMKAKGLL